LGLKSNGEDIHMGPMEKEALEQSHPEREVGQMKGLFSCFGCIFVAILQSEFSFQVNVRSHWHQISFHL
jgi:hypothetical protein